MEYKNCAYIPVVGVSVFRLSPTVLRVCFLCQISTTCTQVPTQLKRRYTCGVGTEAAIGRWAPRSSVIGSGAWPTSGISGAYWLVNESTPLWLQHKHVLKVWPENETCSTRQPLASIGVKTLSGVISLWTNRGNVITLMDIRAYLQVKLLIFVWHTPLFSTHYVLAIKSRNKTIFLRNTS